MYAFQKGQRKVVALLSLLFTEYVWMTPGRQVASAVSVRMYTFVIFISYSYCFGYVGPMAFTLLDLRR